MGNGTSAGLERKLGLFPLTNVVIANMIGAGIFTTSGLLMNDLGNPLLLLSLWVVGGVIALCGALSYGMLGAAIPHSGGEYAFLLGPRVYHSMANDRLFFRGLAHVDPGSNVPARSIALQGVLSSIMVKSFATAGEKSSWYPWAPIIYLASGTCILLLSFFHRPAESSLAILSVLAGVPVYACFKRNGTGA